MTEETPIDPLPGEGPPQAVPPAAQAPGAYDPAATPITGSDGLPAVMPSSSERTWGMLCHLSAFGLFVFPAFGNLIGPLIIWLVKKDESTFVDDQGKEVLNFQISATIYLFVTGFLSFLLIGIPFLVALGIFWFVIVIVAAVQANEGKPYRYPLTIRFIN